MTKCGTKLSKRNMFSPMRNRNISEVLILLTPTYNRTVDMSKPHICLFTKTYHTAFMV